ncbi:von Willebrand factor A domain-containing protein 7 isoform X2 [Ambystoma mexicanum]
MDYSLAWLIPCLWALMLLPRGSHGFFPNFWSKAMSFSWTSSTHQDITEAAILNVTLELFMGMRDQRGRAMKALDFKGKTLIADDLIYAYFGSKVSPKRFRSAIIDVVNANAAMDFQNTTRNDPPLHFDSENIWTANRLLLDTRKGIVQDVHAEHYEAAREKLGKLLHSLQDFYSHSNWVEMGYRKVHPEILTPGKDVSSIAEANVPTCTDCGEWTCKDNILESFNKRKLLTTGYFGTEQEKPQGKCSHGGYFDESTHRNPRGGINKDSHSPVFSPHHYLHGDAAKLAQEASIKFLRELWKDLKDKHFMRLLNIGSSTGLSFVIDTTGSMGEEIMAAKLQTRAIIEKRRYTPEEPDYYVLVPFHDPEFGPVYKTRNPDEFWTFLNLLSPLGGGDEPEMSLSAIQLALMNTPPHSEIFVFTDASAKDAELKKAVESLIQERKAKVTFLITEDPSRSMVGSSRGRGRRELLPANRFDLYASLAQNSGGQIVFTNNENIKDVSTIIEDATNSTTVTLFHIQKTATGVQSRENYHFQLDSLLESVTIHIHGKVLYFEITNPAGRRQSNLMPNGPLGHITTYGHFSKVTLRAPMLVGQWMVELEAQDSHTVHVQGQSLLDFLYYFAVPVNGSHPGLYKLDSRPITGVNCVMVMAVTGLPPGSSTHLDQVTLMGSAGRTLGQMALQETNHTGLYVAEVDSVPEEGFSILMSGRDGEDRPLVRTSPQVNTPVDCHMEVVSDAPLLPAHWHKITVSITNYGQSQEYILMSKNNGGLPMNVSTLRVQVPGNETAQGHFWMLVPAQMEPGSTVTVSTQATSTEGEHSNFAFLQLQVTEPAEMKAVAGPNCTVTALEENCSDELPCEAATWKATLRVQDTVGVKEVRVAQGEGRASHGADGQAERVLYSSDCCSMDAIILVTNRKGRSGTCRFSAPTAGSGRPVGSRSRGSRAGSWALASLAAMLGAQAAVAFAG